MAAFSELFEIKLNDLREKNNLRHLVPLEARFHSSQVALNFGSNDYLSIAHETNFKEAFVQSLSSVGPFFGSTGSRLLSGDQTVHEALEDDLSRLFSREAALCVASGWHLNTGVLSALNVAGTLILADFSAHASMIDGMQMGRGRFMRFRHNDLTHCETLLKKHYSDFERILIVTESVFSMDGDRADLNALVRLKKRYPKVALYVDEAHAIGVFGATGLGLAEESKTIADIDFLVGTFGKAVSSMGAYVVCDQKAKDYLINTMRPLIFSTALPAVNILWTRYVLASLKTRTSAREHLAKMARFFKEGLLDLGFDVPSSTHIVPAIVKDNDKAIKLSAHLSDHNIWAPAIRPPTVAAGQARLRFSLTSMHSQADLEQVLFLLDHR